MEALEDATLDLYELYTVGKRQYRRLKPEYLTTKLQRSKPSSASASAACDNDEPDTCENEQEEVQYEIKQTSSGFSSELRIDPSYFSAIIGPKGATVTRIRSSTGTQVSIPSRDAKNQIIRVQGPTHEAVTEAINGILFVVKSAANRS